MEEELRQIRDTLIEALRRSETLTIEGRALFARYAAKSEEVMGNALVTGPAGTQPGPAQPATPAQPAVRSRPPVPASEDEEFGGSFMVRPTTPQQPNVPGYRETPNELPRSLRDRRR
jgi:hypothetical protein